MAYDSIIKNGRWFDGTGAASAVRNLGIRDGRVAIITTEELDETGAHVIDASGKWVIPGMVDIHTHYDIEVLEAPALAESVRHGVTTVFVGSCSLGTVYASPTDAGDIFGRVEAIPRRHVIDALTAKKRWNSARQYIQALEELPLGPNVAAFIGHSDIRSAEMGLDRATRKDVRPTKSELAAMEAKLDEALDAGFIGMSVQQLLFDKLDGDICRSRTLPSTYAKTRERRRLNAILRRHGRVLQGGPDIGSLRSLAGFTLGTLGIGRKRLKTTLLAALDAKFNPYVVYMFGPMARFLNTLGGDFRWQHLPVPFEVYADGIDLVVFEELGAGAAALHLTDQVERNALMQDESFRRKFRKEYDAKFHQPGWNRNFFEAEIVDCPDDSVVGKSFGRVGLERGVHPVDAFLDLVVAYGTKLRWRVTLSNHRPRFLKKLAVDPGVQIGFSDAGAHLRNMAFYNIGLRYLRRAYDASKSGQEFMTLEQAVHRVTGELGDWFGIDAGHLRQGDRADIVIVDPEHLDDSLEAYAEAPIPAFGNMPRMVNRNDAAVTAVFINGERVFGDGQPTAILGHQRTGQFLRAGAN